MPPYPGQPTHPATAPAEGAQSDTPQAPAPLRKTPVQARSRERVERILDAAAQLLAERGYDAVKTNQIAKRAGVSIGSLYQFFPNRFAIFHALTDRYRSKIAKILSAQMDPAGFSGPWEDVIDTVVDRLAELWRQEDAFHAVWLAIQNAQELQATDEFHRDALIRDVLVPFLQRVIPNARGEQLHAIALVMFETSNLLLDQSVRSGTEQNQMLIDELKTVIRAYIRAHIDRA